MDFDSFQKLYNKLILSRGIARSFNNEKWFNHCLKGNKEITRLIGGSTVLVDTELETTKGVPPESVIGPKIDKVLEIMPAYLDRYSITRQDLKISMLKKPRRIRTAKHVMGYALRSELGPNKTLKLSKVVSEMGQIWEDSKNHCEKQKVVVSTDPRAFIHIGCGGINGGSCWRSGPTAKFAFGWIPNTFCFYIPTENNPDPGNEELLWGDVPKEYVKMYSTRGIGWIDQEKKSIMISNNYGKNANFTYLSSIWPSIYKKWFNVKNKEVKACSLGNVYPPSGQNTILSYINSPLASFFTDKNLDGNKIVKRFWQEAPTSQQLQDTQGK